MGEYNYKSFNADKDKTIGIKYIKDKVETIFNSTLIGIIELKLKEKNIKTRREYNVEIETEAGIIVEKILNIIEGWITQNEKEVGGFEPSLSPDKVFNLKCKDIKDLSSLFSSYDKKTDQDKNLLEFLFSQFVKIELIKDQNISKESKNFTPLLDNKSFDKVKLLKNENINEKYFDNLEKSINQLNDVMQKYIKERSEKHIEALKNFSKNKFN